MMQSRLGELWQALGGAPEAARTVEVTGAGHLPSLYEVTGLAAASVGAAGLALAELIGSATGRAPHVRVDRRLASFWFSSSLAPIGWEPPPLWDAIAGDYRTADGWIRLHTNAPHHRRAAQSVLGAHDSRSAMADAVARWSAGELESAVVAAGGCAAEMRAAADWRMHPAGMAVAGEPLVQIEPFSGAARGWRFDPARPLRGVRVLDLTRVLAGPVATRLLAGYGAEVLRIDPPSWSEPGVEPEMTLGKTCGRLDVTLREDRAALLRALARADVMVHGYRSDALEKLGIGRDVRRSLNPDLIDVSLDAYGFSGPWAARRGFDSLVQMSCGIAEAGMRWKSAEAPVPLPCQALDHATGYLMAAAALKGLSRRMATGGGLRARLSLARTAETLKSWGPQPEGEALAVKSAEDLAPAIEDTGWGPARRLKPPLAVADCPMHWTLPARPLGSWREQDRP